VFDIGQHQLLMLLFVVYSQSDDWCEPIYERGILKNRIHQRIHSIPVL
jgi:hypothetical protein